MCRKILRALATALALAALIATFAPTTASAGRVSIDPNGVAMDGRAEVDPDGAPAARSSFDPDGVAAALRPATGHRAGFDPNGRL